MARKAVEFCWESFSDSLWKDEACRALGQWWQIAKPRSIHHSRSRITPADVPVPHSRAVARNTALPVACASKGKLPYMTSTRKRSIFIGFSSASFFIVGIGIVLPAWVAFHAGGSSLVGLVMLTSSIAGFALAPVAGHLVDRYRRIAVTASGQLIRALGLCALALVPWVPDTFVPALLITSGILGAFGYALLAGALSGVLQSLVPENERLAFNMRLSFFNQAGIAIGTGAGGWAINRFGSTTTAIVSASIAVAILPLLGNLASAAGGKTTRKRTSLLAASLDALRYLVNEPQSFAAAVTVGLAFAVIQITNLLLPGFVIHKLGGDSHLFGILEMTAAIAGMAALALAGFPPVAKKIRDTTTAVLGGAGGSLVLLSLAPNTPTAIVLYCLAGMLWNLSRAAANGHLLTVVDPAVIGRVQAFTTLLTGAFGALIFLLPTMFPDATEAHLYVACGAAIVVAAALVGLWSTRRKPGPV
jgi:MFS family permease